MSLSNFEPKTILAQKYRMIFIKSVTNVTLPSTLALVACS